MTTNSSNSDAEEFIRRVLATSSDKFFDNLKKDEKLSKEDIEKQAVINDYQRGEAAKKCLHRLELIVIWGIFVAVIALGFSYIWHLVTPWAYLSDKQLEKINTILSSAILASVLSSRFKRYF